MQELELSTADLYQSCDLTKLNFQTTADLKPLEEVSEAIGQPRAIEALRFGTGIKQKGYNIYALGPSGTGRHSLVRQFLTKRAKQKDTPDDWCYVNNFEDSSKPDVLRLPPGQGTDFAQDMDHIIQEARNALKAAFESEEFQNRSQAIEEEFKEKQQKAFEELQQKAKEKNLTVLKTPSGLAFGVLKDGEVLPPEEFRKLPDEERKKIESEIEELQKESQRIFQKIPAWERDVREKIKKITREVAQYAVKPLIDELRTKYQELTAVCQYLDAVQKDIVENVSSLLNPHGQQQNKQQGGIAQFSGQMERSTDKSELETPALRRYRVNVLVAHSKEQGSPIIYEDNPTYSNIVGRVEHLSQMGTLITDFHLIRPGALHKANGGALILDAHKILMQPGAWEGLKRSLNSGEIKIESLAQMFSLISTVSLEPKPVPLDVKVILVGSALLNYLLKELDPEFADLFKVSADFDVLMNRDEDNQNLYARLISNIVRKESLLDFNQQAVGRLIEYSARMAGDSEKLSTRVRSVSDCAREASFWAEENKKEFVDAEDVQKAIDAWTYRSDRIRERIQEEIHRGTIHIQTKGKVPGQVNGLSVLMLGDFMFGRPSRITARTRLGKGEVLDIEREAKLSGPIHSKGVLILSGFLSSRYALDQPLSLSASLVFEQSYSGIEGDSASSAELYALLSSLADLPLKQSLAVTGSVDQFGNIQAIGGVNEKIEGFFDICKARGLSKEQGVLIPETNVKHLMLRKDVIESVKNKEFHIYAVNSIDQGIELLTDIKAGQADQEGKYPEDTVNGKVQSKLMHFASKRLNYMQANWQGGQGDTGN